MSLRMSGEAKKEKVIIYTDGGSRGNPGPAAVGAVIKDAKGHTLKSYGQTIGRRTNNEAEYEAVLFALKKVKQLYGKARVRNLTLEFRLDSELVARQLSGTYKVEEERLFPLFMKIHNFQVEFGPLRFAHVPRARNKEADALVNEALDADMGRSMSLFE